MKIVVVVLAIITLMGIIISSIKDFGFNICKFRIKFYWLIPFAVALAFLLFGILPFGNFTNALFSNEGMNPLKILILFFCMTGISVFLDELGLFSFLAYKVIKGNKTSQFRVYVALCILVSLLTMFTSNDIVILTFTPFIIFFCRRTKCNPIPYLVSEFVLANTWSMMFIIGNPTNIYLGTSYGLNFSEYLKVMFFPTIIVGLFEFIILVVLFNKDLRKEFEYCDEEESLDNKILTIFGLISLLGCLVFLVLSSYLPLLEMHLICLLSFVALLIASLIYCVITKYKFSIFASTFRRLPFELIPFLLSMFTITLALSYYGITESMCSIFGSNVPNFVYGFSALISCNLINNIPMSVLYSNIIAYSNPEITKVALYSTIIGSNLGAFITPIGALAGIMWMGILKRHEIKFNYLDFIKYGIAIGIPTAFLAFLILPVFL